MSTKHLVLSLLDIEPASGYDLAFRCLDSLGPIWSATHSQIYTTLHKLLAAGLVEAEGEDGCPNGRRRVVYAITAKGRQELDHWRNEPIAYLPSRDPLLFWAQHMDAVPLATTLEVLDAHEARSREALELALAKSIEIREGRNDILERRRGSMTEEQIVRARVSRAAIYDELVRDAQMQVERAERLRRVAERIEEMRQADAGAAAR